MLSTTPPLHFIRTATLCHSALTDECLRDLRVLVAPPYPAAICITGLCFPTASHTSLLRSLRTCLLGWNVFLSSPDSRGLITLLTLVPKYFLGASSRVFRDRFFPAPPGTWTPHPTLLPVYISGRNAAAPTVIMNCGEWSASLAPICALYVSWAQSCQATLLLVNALVPPDFGLPLPLSWACHVFTPPPPAPLAAARGALYVYPSQSIPPRDVPATVSLGHCWWDTHLPITAIPALPDPLLHPRRGRFQRQAWFETRDTCSSKVTAVMAAAKPSLDSLPDDLSRAVYLMLLSTHFAPVSRG